MEQYSNLNVHGNITQKADQGTGTDDVVKYPTLTGRVPNVLPAATSANAGKAVVVNSAGNGLEFGEAGKVDDVKIGTTSLVNNKKIATIPAATSSAKGVVQTGTGITNSSGTISVTYGNTAGTACQGNDSRLSNARTPTSHTHGNIANDGSISSNKGTIVITNSSTGKLEASGKSIETNKANITTTATSTIPTSAAIAGAIADAIDAMPEPMIFKGTLGTGGTETSLPTASASNEGFTYKVITAGTYASQKAKIGDTFISTGSAWVLIPSGDEPSGTVTSVATDNVYLQTNQTNSGPITTSGTISHKTSGVTAGSYGPSDNATPGYGATFNVPYITVNAAGHVTAASTKTVKIPASDNTDTKVTSAANHYAPEADDDAELSASASGATAAWSIDVVQGVTLSRDAKGHVTGIAVTSGKIPANPNTDTKVRQTTLNGSDNVNRAVILAYNVNTTTGNTDNIVYRSTKIYANDSTGTITATKFTGALTGNVTGNCSGSAGSVAWSGVTSNPFAATDVTLADM